MLLRRCMLVQRSKIHFVGCSWTETNATYDKRKDESTFSEANRLRLFHAIWVESFFEDASATEEIFSRAFGSARDSSPSCLLFHLFARGELALNGARARACRVCVSRKCSVAETCIIYSPLAIDFGYSALMEKGCLTNCALPRDAAEPLCIFFEENNIFPTYCLAR